MSRIPPGELVPIQQAFRLGQVWYADRLDPEWRPRGLEEALAVFESVGLAGGFWGE